jgi:predicted RNase H-related nuclease YkuK (DUF458 family)
MKFKNYSGQEVDVIKEIKNKLENGYDYKLYIGTDSQVNRKCKKTVYSTVIVLHKSNKGGVIYIQKNEKKRLITLRERLINEAWLSLECAHKLVENLSKNKVEIQIHIDVNKDKKYASGQYVEELVGFVVNQGFICVTKPEGWAATKAADKFSR